VSIWWNPQKQSTTTGTGVSVCACEWAGRNHKKHHGSEVPADHFPVCVPGNAPPQPTPMHACTRIRAPYLYEIVNIYICAP
jgi:hypothetical protein